MNNHYHGRIKTHELADGQHTIVEDRPGDWLAGILAFGTDHFIMPDNARRLVACWNALVGIETALIEDGRLFALLMPTKLFTAAATEALMHKLGNAGWRDYTGGSVAPIQRLLNDLLQEHAPATHIAQQIAKCSRTNDVQERSYQEHGADYKERMLAAFAFCRQLEIELTIARDLLHIAEGRQAQTDAPPVEPDDRHPPKSEGAKP